MLAAGWNTADVAVEDLVPEDLDQAVRPPVGLEMWDKCIP